MLPFPVAESTKQEPTAAASDRKVTSSDLGHQYNDGHEACHLAVKLLLLLVQQILVIVCRDFCAVLRELLLLLLQQILVTDCGDFCADLSESCYSCCR